MVNLQSSSNPMLGGEFRRKCPLDWPRRMAATKQKYSLENAGIFVGISLELGGLAVSNWLIVGGFRAVKEGEKRNEDDENLARVEEIERRRGRK